MQVACLYRLAQRAAVPEYMFLSGKLIEVCRSHAISERAVCVDLIHHAVYPGRPVTAGCL
jgi:hypothetical protein